jgi:hypothetical protein
MVRPHVYQQRARIGNAKATLQLAGCLKSSRAILQSMSTVLRVSVGVVLIAASVRSAVSAPLNLEVVSDRRKLKSDKSQTESTNSSTENWGYKVVILNKAFQPVEGLDVVYRVYKRDDSRTGVAEKLVATPGSKVIASLKPGEKFTFDTESVVLSKSTLKAGWTYTDKSKATVEDGVAGLWLRIMKDGGVVFEHIKPTTLKTKVKWE